MKKFVSVCSAILLTVLLTLTVLPVSAATGTLSASASAKAVTVGGSVTVTLKYSGGGAPIGAIDAGVSYNAAVLEYVSGGGGDTSVSGGAGVLTISNFASGTAPTSVTVTLTFKALAAGSGNIKVTTGGMMNDDDGTNLGTPSASVEVNVSNPTLSNNADLKSIKLSSGTLAPGFGANTLEYTVSVPYTTTSLSVSAEAAQSGAKVAVSGSNALQVGKNTRVITVTAPGGAVKKYTVVINRSQNQTTTGKTGTGDSTTTASTTAAPPEEDPLEVSVDGETKVIRDTQTGIALPDGYAWDSATVNGVEVSVAVNKTADITLVCLADSKEDAGRFYVYHEETERFSPFRTMTAGGKLYLLNDVASDRSVPTGAKRGECTIGEETVAALEYTAPGYEGVYLLELTAPDGYTGLYTYDTGDGSLQKYRDPIAPDEPDTDEEETVSPVIAFCKNYRMPLMIGAAALVGLGLILLAVVLILRGRNGSGDCKH